MNMLALDFILIFIMKKCQKLQTSIKVVYHMLSMIDHFHHESSPTSNDNSVNSPFPSKKAKSFKRPWLPWYKTNLLYAFSKPLTSMQVLSNFLYKDHVT